MSTAALAVAARRVAAAGAARRMAPTATRAFAAPQPMRAGLHTGAAARAAAGDEQPGMFEKIKRMFGISKQHVAGAWSMRDLLRVHHSESFVRASRCKLQKRDHFATSQAKICCNAAISEALIPLLATPLLVVLCCCTAGAASNQAQAARDIGSGRASMSDELKEHGKAAAADVKQWGHELKETAEGKNVRSAKVRDMPPRFEGQPVKDNVSEKPLGTPAKEADAGKPEASRRMGPGPVGGPGTGTGSGASSSGSFKM